MRCIPHILQPESKVRGGLPQINPKLKERGLLVVNFRWPRARVVYYVEYIEVAMVHMIHVTCWAKTRHFCTFFTFFFIASVFCIVSKERTAEVSASCNGAKVLQNWNNKNLYSLLHSPLTATSIRVNKSSCTSLCWLMKTLFQQSNHDGMQNFYPITIKHL